MKSPIATLIAMIAFAYVSKGQYTHFNIQTTQGLGMQYSECGENYTAFCMREANFNEGGGTYLRKIEMSPEGIVIGQESIFLDQAGGSPPCNPEEVILKVLDSQFVASTVNIDCASYYPRLVSFDEELEVIWSLDFNYWVGCDLVEKFTNGPLIKCDENSFALVCGAYRHNENNIDDYGYRLTKIDHDGNLLFDQVFYETDFQLMELYGGEKIQDGYLVWGSFARLDWMQLNCQPDIFNGILKLGEDGTLVEFISLDDDDDFADSIIAMEFLPNGLLAGIYCNATEQNCDTGLVRGKPRVVVLDINDLDNPVHDVYLDIVEIGNNEFTSFNFQDLKALPDNGFVGLCHFAFVGNDVKSLLIHITPDYVMDWYTFLQAPNLPTRNFAQTVNTTPDGGYFVGGYCTDATAPLWYLKLDACGYLEESDCPAVIGVGEMNSAQIQCSPNPFIDLLQIKMDEPIQQIFITDIAGRVVFQEKTNQVSVRVDLSHLSSGSYLLRCTNELDEVVVEKLVKE